MTGCGCCAEKKKQLAILMQQTFQQLSSVSEGVPASLPFYALSAVTGSVSFILLLPVLWDTAWTNHGRSIKRITVTSLPPIIMMIITINNNNNHHYRVTHNPSLKALVSGITDKFRIMMHDFFLTSIQLYLARSRSWISPPPA